MRKGLLFLLTGILLLVACQPQVMEVEVTRVVDEGEAAHSAAPTAVPLEVTRLVEVEVTRVMTEEVVVEVTPAPLGSEVRPIQVLFPATAVNSSVAATRGEGLIDALQTATGLQFEIGVVDDEETVADLMCAAPTDTIGFLSAMGYVLANERCGVQPANVATGPEGLTWDAGMLVTRRDTGLRELADLSDGRWAIPDTGSVPNYLYFKALLQDAGIPIAEEVTFSSDNNALLSVYNGEVDFATATYIPPIMPYEEREWQYGEDSPEVWRILGIDPTRSPIGYVLVGGEPEFGGYRVRDTRSGIFDIEPEIFILTRILTLSAPIPNETVTLGASFPVGLARQVSATLNTFAASEACGDSVCSADFYGWTGLEPATDDLYEPLRFTKETLDLTEEEIWALVQ